MSQSANPQAWLEKPGGEIAPVQGTLSFGRTPPNDVVLADERVSRRHALIHPQGPEEFWLVDLGSRNGTYVNERRVSQPIRLRDGDQIRLGPFGFTFRQPLAAGGLRPEQATTLATLLDLKTVPCWLLVLDVERSTELAKSLHPEEVAILMGRWFKHCRQSIETHGGTINKYLGDGLLAYWPAPAGDATALAKTLDSLRQLQRSGSPPFRIVLHCGPVTFGGGASLGEESLSGPEVNFAFRMEKLAAALRQSILVSEPAATALQATAARNPLGEHVVPSFEGRHRFFGL